MRGYKELPDGISERAAQAVQQADQCAQAKDFAGAVAILEQLLREARETSSVIPDWLSGRLASLYRSQRRYWDEVEILEQFQDSQTDDEERSRHSARITKARALAERSAVNHSGALNSVRESKARIKLEESSKLQRSTPRTQPYEAAMRAALWDGDPAAVELRLARLMTELHRTGRRRAYTIDNIVRSIQKLRDSEPRPPHVSEAQWHDLHSRALTCVVSRWLVEKGNGEGQ